MDSLLLKKRIISGDEVCLAAVCDGVGSLESGAVASSLAIQMLIEWLNGVEDTERIGLARHSLRCCWQGGDTTQRMWAIAVSTPVLPLDYCS